MSEVSPEATADSQTPPETSCAVCGVSGNWHKCGGCLQVAYCSKDHQRMHWKTHKNDCCPIKMAVSPELGRHYVAARKLKVGDVVIKEEPILVFPRLESDPDVCLGCYSTIRLIPDVGARVSCSKCGLPVCSRDCEASSDHSAECRIISDFNKVILGEERRNAGASSGGGPQAAAIGGIAFGREAAGRFGKLVAVLRAVAMGTNYKSNGHSNKSKSKWNDLLCLESHLDVRSDDVEFWRGQEWIDKILVSVLDSLQIDVRSASQAASHSEGREATSTTAYSNLSARIVSILEVNSFQVSNTNAFAAYPRAAMMEHSCFPNVAKTFDSEGRLHLRVLRPVEKGERLAHCYTEPLWGKLSRKFHLGATKFFDCRCPRCVDPSELGTHFNAIKCPICINGYVEPHEVAPKFGTSPLVVETSWKCTNRSCRSSRQTKHGGVEQDSGLLDDVVATVTEDLKALDPTDVVAFEDFLDRYSSVLHPNHHCAVEASRVLSQLYGNGPAVCTPGNCNGGGRGDVDDRHLAANINNNDDSYTLGGSRTLSMKQLRLKEKHCRKVLEVTRILTPGPTRLKGATLLELQSTLKHMAFLDRDINCSVRLLTEARKLLEECVDMMDVKVEGSTEEALIAAAAKAELGAINLHLFQARALAGAGPGG